jgi:hypothetical protein
MRATYDRKGGTDENYADAPSGQASGNDIIFSAEGVRRNY